MKAVLNPMNFLVLIFLLAGGRARFQGGECCLMLLSAASHAPSRPIQGWRLGIRAFPKPTLCRVEIRETPFLTKLIFFSKLAGLSLTITADAICFQWFEDFYGGSGGRLDIVSA
jgi:hypothetical protein